MSPERLNRVVLFPNALLDVFTLPFVIQMSSTLLLVEIHVKILIYLFSLLVLLLENPQKSELIGEPLSLAKGHLYADLKNRKEINPI